jgi:S-adenosylmethionine hydrolase
VLLPSPLVGAPRVVHVDRYGNLVTNLTGASFAAAAGVKIAGREVPRHHTYGDVRAGELLAYVGSFGLVEIGKNGGSAAAALDVQRGASVALLPA